MIKKIFFLSIVAICISCGGEDLEDLALTQMAEIDGLISSSRTLTLEGGVEVQVTHEGDGQSPSIADNVTVHYEGRLTDGTIFDSSVGRNESASFPLSGVIRGWQIGIPALSVGGAGRIIIPSDLAYGANSPSPLIPPNSDLIFDVALIDIN